MEGKRGNTSTMKKSNDDGCEWRKNKWEMKAGGGGVCGLNKSGGDNSSLNLKPDNSSPVAGGVPAG